MGANFKGGRKLMVLDRGGAGAGPAGVEREVNASSMIGYYMEQGYSSIVMVSAAKRENIDQLRSMLTQQITRLHLQIYPNSEHMTTNNLMDGEVWNS